MMQILPYAQSRSIIEMPGSDQCGVIQPCGTGRCVRLHSGHHKQSGHLTQPPRTEAAQAWGNSRVMPGPIADCCCGRMKMCVSVLWHGLAAIIGLSAIALIDAAWLPIAPQPLLWIVGAQTLAIGPMFILFGLIRTNSLWVGPQWIILVPLGLFILWTARAAGITFAG